jgi:hypothetical protein
MQLKYVYIGNRGVGLAFQPMHAGTWKAKFIHLVGLVFFSLNEYKTHHLFIFYIKTLVAQPFYKLIYKFQNTLKRVEKQKIKPNQSRILNSIYIYIYWDIINKSDFVQSNIKISFF